MKKTLFGPKELAVVLAGFSGGAVTYPLSPLRCLIANTTKPNAGSKFGPSALLGPGIIDELRSHFKQIHVCQEFPTPMDITIPDTDYVGMKRPRSVSAATQNVHNRVYDHAQLGRFVLTLGGDHSNAIGTLTGTAKAFNAKIRQRPAVICVDAHVSINTPELSPSGFIHGMPLAFATGLATARHDGIFDWLEDAQFIDMKRLVYIGTRDVDNGERHILDQNGIKTFDMKYIQK